MHILEFKLEDVLPDLEVGRLEKGREVGDVTAHGVRVDVHGLALEVEGLLLGLELDVP